MKVIYFLYFLKKTNFAFLHLQIKHVAQQKKWSYVQLVLKILESFLKYNSSFLDYFSFKFYEKSDEQVKEYISPVYLYKFQKALNESGARDYFKKKNLFLEKFHEFIDHKHFLPFENNQKAFITWLEVCQPSTLILKNSKGDRGIGIEKIKVSQKNDHYSFDKMDLEEFYVFIQKNTLDLIEVGIEQHPVLSNIYAHSLNTVRIITILDKNMEVHILGAMIRIGTKGFVDNFSAGGVSAQVDLETGTVIAPLVSKDSRMKHSNGRHPVTDEAIIGVTLPLWQELKEMIVKAACVVPEARTIGWDVAITEKGVYLLEGNDNWNQNIWQRTSGKGHKNVLEKFLT